MSKISIYEVVPVPKLADKLVGTSVGGEPEDLTYNFTLGELLNLFIPNIPGNTLQGVLDFGNTATQDIILNGTIFTTYLEVTDTATILDSFLTGETHITGGLYDRLNSIGTAGQVLRSTGTQVEWYSIPNVIPTLQQVLASGNTADINIILSSNIQALTATANNVVSNTSLSVNGTLKDKDASVGASGQILSSTGTKVQWIDLPVYTATSPLNINSSTRVISIQQANASQSGYLSSLDWINFDGKQNAGNYIVSLIGEATGIGPGAATVTLNTAAVTGKLLTGLNLSAGGNISATDSILVAFGKVQNQISSTLSGVVYKGVWNAATNSPTLSSSVGVQGWYYVVNVAGNTDLNGITDWQVGDWAIFNGTVWNKVDNTDSVTSVNGQVGAVSLTTDNIPEGATNLYFLNSRARAALSFVAGSGAYNNTTGVITIPTDNSQILNGANYITLALLSASSPLNYNNLTGAFSIQVANTTQNGYLSSTDWNTFNGKQPFLGGTGLVKSVAGTISYITDNSSNWNTAYNDSIVSAAVTGTATKTLTLNQQDGGTITASWSDIDTGLTSVGVSMPSAFSVANSPLTANGTIAVTGAGTTAQYIRGDGSLATFPTIATEAQRLITEVYNETGATLTKGTVVYINGGHGNLPTITKAIATGDATSAQTYGIVQTDITNMNNGYVVVIGSLGDLDTQAYANGTQLYLSSTTAGAWTSVKQYAPAHLVYVAIVTRSHPTQGVVEVRIQNGFEMDELHNVSAQTPSNGSILQYVSSTQLWTAVAGTTTNIAEGANLYYLDSRARAAVSLTTTGSSGASTYNSTTGVFNIPNYTLSGLGGVPTSRTLTINGIAYDLSADRSWSVGTVTSVSALTLGTTGTDLSSSVATGTTTPVITLNVPTASAANRGALSAADWSTFNTKVGSVTASSPLASSGGSTPNITIQQSSGSQAGFLSAADWTTFNNKQAAGNYITSLTGEATATGPGAASVTLSNSAVTAKVLTGINITGGTVVDTDSILTGFGKLQNQINSLVGGTIYKGTWNASTNTPTLTSGVGTKGWYYIVNVAGTTNLDGITDWFVGDWAIFDGTAWQQVDNTDAVTSVNGQTGAVSLTTDNIPEGSTNQYFLNSRARAALSFTAGSGAYNSTTGVITIPTNTSQLTNGANFITLASLSGTAPIVYSNTTGAISITQSGTASNGYLSSTDWNTFNNKQATISLTTTGTSGAATLVGTTLNVPNYGGALTGYVPYTGATGAVDLGGFNITAGGTSSFVAATLTSNLWLKNTGTYDLIISNGTSLTTNNVKAYYTTTDELRFYAKNTAGASVVPKIMVGDGTTFTQLGTGSVTSVAALTIGTSGTDLSSSVANSTTTPVITLNVPTASATNRGALSSADWTTFNNKQSALTNPVTGTGTTNYLPKFTGTSTIGNSLLYQNDTRSVSINVTTGTNDDGNLVVAGSDGTGQGAANTVAQINIWETTSGSKSGLWFGAMTNEATGVIGSRRANGNIAFQTYNGSWSEKMRLTSSGNLGLGVTPSAWWSGMKAIEVQGSSGGVFASAAINGHFLTNGYYDGTNWVYKNTGFVSYYSQTVGQHQWLTAPSGTAGAAITFTQAMTLTASGNLSIGNTNDSYKLDVQGIAVIRNDGAAFQLLSSSTSTQYQKWSNAGGNYFVGISSSAGGGLLGSQNAYSFCLVTESARDMSFGTSNLSRMTIFSDGNVGINTGATNAGYKLDVNGTGRFSGRLLVNHSTASDYAAVIYNTSATGEGLVVRGGSTSSHNAFVVQPYNGAVSLFSVLATGAATFSSSVNTGGLVTVNKTNEGLILTAGTNTDASYMSTRANNGTGWLIMGSQGSVANYIQSGTGANESAITTVGAYALALGTNQVERMRITSTGNVLIGTTTDGGFKTYIKAGASGLLLSAGTTSSDNAVLIQNAAETTTLLTIKGTGAATFSSSVTAGGDILANGSSIFTKAASGGYQISLNAQASTQKIRFDDLTGGAYGVLSLQAGNGSGSFVDRLTIANSGNVGIGTTSPSSILTVLKTITTNPGAKGNAALSLGTAGSAGEYNLINFGYDAESWQPAYFGYLCTSGAGSSNGALVFGTRSATTNSQPSEVIRITSGGNVLIGTTDDGGRLVSYSTTAATQIKAAGTAPAITFSNTVLSPTIGGVLGVATAADQFFTGTASSDMVLANQFTAGALIFGTSNVARMRISVGGNVLMGKTVTGAVLTNGFEFNPTDNYLSICNSTSANYSLYVANTGTSGTRNMVAFYGTSSLVGSITYNGTVTAYNSTSDYRLKQDFKNYNGLDLISAIKTYDYEWKSDKSRMYGVMAHELQEILPYAVTGIKDGKEMQQVDYSKIVPILVKSIQELKLEIETLKNK